MAKITLTTVKSFIRKNADNLYINVKSKFDGMTDGCERQDDGWRKVVMTDNNLQYTHGVSGAWFVGSSRDSFDPYEAGGFTGIEVYNCCGHFILAVKTN